MFSDFGRQMKATPVGDTEMACIAIPFPFIARNGRTSRCAHLMGELFVRHLLHHHYLHYSQTTLRSYIVDTEQDALLVVATILHTANADT